MFERRGKQKWGLKNVICFFDQVRDPSEKKPSSLGRICRNRPRRTPSRDVGKGTKPPSISDRTRRIILENLGRVEKKTLRELVAGAGITVTKSSFDTIYYETNKTMQIAREMGLVK
jgi:hypothetical protein